MAIHRNLMLARLVAAAGASLVLLGAQASSESVRKAKPAPVQPANSISACRSPISSSTP